MSAAALTTLALMGATLLSIGLFLMFYTPPQPEEKPRGATKGNPKRHQDERREWMANQRSINGLRYAGRKQ